MRNQARNAGQAGYELSDGRFGQKVCLPAGIDKSHFQSITRVGDAFEKYIDTATGKTHDCAEYFRLMNLNREAAMTANAWKRSAWDDLHIAMYDHRADDPQQRFPAKIEVNRSVLLELRQDKRALAGGMKLERDTEFFLGVMLVINDLATRPQLHGHDGRVSSL